MRLYALCVRVCVYPWCYVCAFSHGARQRGKSAMRTRCACSRTHRAARDQRSLCAERRTCPRAPGTSFSLFTVWYLWPLLARLPCVFAAHERVAVFAAHERLFLLPMSGGLASWL
jgi:hypothetical protein